VNAAIWAGALAGVLLAVSIVFGLHARRLAQQLGEANADRDALKESLMHSARLLQRARRARPTRAELRAAVGRMSQDSDDS
jgi:hypothetical protein